MAEEFNYESAKQRQEEVLNDVRRIRDILDKEIVLYYRNLFPDNEDEEIHYREVMRRYLHNAKIEIDRLLEGRLY